MARLLSLKFYIMHEMQYLRFDHLKLFWRHELSRRFGKVKILYFVKFGDALSGKTNWRMRMRIAAEPLPVRHRQPKTCRRRAPWPFTLKYEAPATGIFACPGCEWASLTSSIILWYTISESCTHQLPKFGRWDGRADLKKNTRSTPGTCVKF